MKYKISIYIIALLCTPLFVAHAEVEESNLFTTKTDAIINYEDFGVTQFNIDVDAVNSNDIAYWKVRLYCDDDIFVTLTSLEHNHCGKAVTLSGSNLEKFSLFFKSSEETPSKFKFKLKAYDMKGDWLATQQQSFSWK